MAPPKESLPTDAPENIPHTAVETSDEQPGPLDLPLYSTEELGNLANIYNELGLHNLIPLSMAPPESTRRLLLETSDQQPYPRDLSLKIDGKLGNLANIYNEFGLRAVEATMLGLSRPFNTTTNDVEELIGEWELRDMKCCYQGSVHDLFRKTDTMILAISYRHAEEEHWERKGKDRTCKLQPEDEVLLASAVAAFSRMTPKLMVWCDQILTTRTNPKSETGFSWHHIGLLPYMTFRVLNLSSHLPEEKLERRVWIRAERSLGRMANGIFKANEVSQNILIGELGHGASGWNCMQHLAKHILSGYWPEDLERWKTDFQKMKRWALGVLFRRRQFFSIPLFHPHEKDVVDNTEILSNIGELAAIPDFMEDVEPVILVKDEHFFMKATAWNLSIRTLWKDNPPYISHYMGQGNAQFSWWQCKQRNVLFGCLICGSRSTTMVAVYSIDGYRVLKGRGNLSLYVHGERVAGPKTREQIIEAGKKAGIALGQDLEWVLLYCFDGTDINDICTPSEVVRAIQQQTPNSEETPEATVMVPPVFRGMTTNIFKCAVVKRGGNAAEVARSICECVAEWNDHVKRAYPSWITVKDTTVGPVWLEGFDEEKVSFGFLEFLTETVLINRRSIPANFVKMAISGDVTQELRALLPKMKSDEQCLTQELVKGFNVTEDNRLFELSRRDLAQFILCGGFGKSFTPVARTAFLRSMAWTSGYWATMVVCRNGVMQIRFTDVRGEKRIAQRKTGLQNYTGRGVVNPKDYEKVREISVSYNTSDERHVVMNYWNEMEDTTTREEMWRGLHNSRRVYNEKEILLADMTVGETEEDCLLGDGNDFAKEGDPFLKLPLVRSGLAGSFFKTVEKIQSTYETRFREQLSLIGQELDAIRNQAAKNLDE